MKKYFFILAAFFFAACSVYGQKELSKDYSYTVSEPYKVFDGQKNYFSKGNQIMTVKIRPKEVLIQKFDNSGDKIKFIGEKSFTDFPGNMQPEDVKEYNGKYYYFYSSWDGGHVDNEQLFVREIDFDKGVFAGDGRLLFKVNGRVTGSPIAMVNEGFFSFGIGVQNKFDILTSLDKKQMLIQYRRKPEVKRDTKSYDIIGMNSFDENMKMTSSNEIKMPYTERRMDNLDYAIDREGNMYILAKVYHDDSNRDKKHRKDTEANYHIELFRIKNGSTDIDITKIDIKNTFIHGLWLYESPDNYMICAGYYNGEGPKSGISVGPMKITEGDINGVVMFKVGKDGAIYDEATYEIPIDVINAYSSKRAQRKNNKKEAKGEAEMSDLKLSELVINSDGSLLVIGEQKYIVEHYSSTGMGMTNVTYVYYYNDILLTKIDPSGNLAWMKKIPKKQAGSNGEGGMSYKYMYANGFDYIFFLDNVKNYNLPLDKGPALHSDGKGGYFTSYKINDADGTAVNSSIFNVRETDDLHLYQFSTDRIVKTGEDEFAVEFYKKHKEDVMVKVKVK